MIIRLNQKACQPLSILMPILGIMRRHAISQNRQMTSHEWNRPTHCPKDHACLGTQSIIVKGRRGLEYLPGGFHELVLEDCPELQVVSISGLTKRLLINNCPRLRSIQPWTDGNDLSSLMGNEIIYELEELSLQDCPMLCGLPLRLRVMKNLCLRGIGSVGHWPRDLMIGGDLRIADCPAMEMLPSMEVRGSLAISGRSGLRRLSPGTIIGRNLDLRSCIDLEGVPSDLRVGGLISLPKHLRDDQGRTALSPDLSAIYEAEPHLEIHEHLKLLFLARQFPALIPTGGLAEAENRGNACLSKIKTCLRQHPALEPLILGTASRVWTDLNEEAWFQWAPWACERKQANDDFPKQWFLALVREIETPSGPTGSLLRRRRGRSLTVTRPC